MLLSVYFCNQNYVGSDTAFEWEVKSKSYKNAKLNMESRMPDEERRKAEDPRRGPPNRRVQAFPRRRGDRVLDEESSSDRRTEYKRAPQRQTQR